MQIARRSERWDHTSLLAAMAAVDRTPYDFHPYKKKPVIPLTRDVVRGLKKVFQK